MLTVIATCVGCWYFTCKTLGLFCDFGILRFFVILAFFLVISDIL